MALNKQKHINFWRMNAKLLPHHYISNDSSRMTLGFFTVAALDLLGELDKLAPRELEGWTEWIYSCQCPEGGFRGFTGTDLGSKRNATNRKWDPPNVPATFFALASLLVLGDDMQRVDRNGCMEWLATTQRTDGSFGEVLGSDGTVEGGTDLRFCCCAAGIAYILQDAKDGAETQINLDTLVSYILSCQNYSGGFGESPSMEPHSGLTYCAVAGLAFVRKLKGKSFKTAEAVQQTEKKAIRWMLDRQTAVLREPKDPDDDDDDTENSSSPDEQAPITSFKPIEIPTAAGFNGREGKIADTCYCFWNTGALSILDATHMIDANGMKQFLLEKAQHMIGGFGKGIGSPPDVMHSYLGLAALGLVRQSDVKSVDPIMCISEEAMTRLNRLRWKQDLADA